MFLLAIAITAVACGGDEENRSPSLPVGPATVQPAGTPDPVSTSTQTQLTTPATSPTQIPTSTPRPTPAPEPTASPTPARIESPTAVPEAQGGRFQPQPLKTQWRPNCLLNVLQRRLSHRPETHLRRAASRCDGSSAQRQSRCGF